MRLTMKERQSVTAVVAARYRRTGKKDKKTILNEFTQVTGYNRSYAGFLLRAWGKRVRINNKLVLVGDGRKKIKRDRPRVYDDNVLCALKKIWMIMDCIGGKRLAPVLGELIATLEQHGEIELDEETKEKLLAISAATIDRLLGKEGKRMSLRRRSRTKPGTLLKHQIPIKTFSQWDEQRPGFVEIDLVGHEGGNTSGDYSQTLDVTDVCTGWTEVQAVKNKAQVWVFEALKQIRQRLPFDLLGIDSDNGSELINDQLYAYLRLYTNYFQPVMKLIEKIRIGSRVKKRYDSLKPHTKES